MPTFTTTVSARDRRDPDAMACVDVTYLYDEYEDIELVSVIVDEPTVQKGLLDILDALCPLEKMTLFRKALKHEEENHG